MGWASDLGRVLVVLFVTTLLVVFLWQAPWFLTFFLVIPLLFCFWFWPENSTYIAYFVGALVGFVFTYWNVFENVASPFSFERLWIPLVWGPAGVIVRRLEEIIVNLFKTT